MSDPGIFIQLLEESDKEQGLREAVQLLSKGESMTKVRLVEPEQFQTVPGSPFSYWVSQRIRALFSSLPRFESEGRVARLTTATSDDARWVRAWWEVLPERIGRSRGWVPLAKGGRFAPFYDDLHLLVAWDETQQTHPGYEGTVNRPDKRPASLNYFFRPGLTWPRRTNGLSFRILPKDSIFGDKGPGVFTDDDSTTYLFRICAVANSSPFRHLVELQLARVELAQSFETGLIQQTPVPTAWPPVLEALALEAFTHRRDEDRTNELSHAFGMPVLLATSGVSLAERTASANQITKKSREDLGQIADAIDQVVLDLYGISDHDLSGSTGTTASTENHAAEEGDNRDEEEVEKTEGDDHAAAKLVSDLLSYLFGVVFGRWDVRIAIDRYIMPELQGPFDPLPVCSPGMLVGPDGLPPNPGGIVSVAWLQARLDAISLPVEGSVLQPTIADTDYPLRIDWDGVLVDDEGHEDDVVRRVRDVLAILWDDGAEAIEQEACAILGVRSLRDYFRNPKGFWDFHVKRYSKSRRKAPIYWLVQSSKRAYGLWLYYPRLDADTLFKALGYVGNRLLLEQSRLTEALEQRQAIGEGDARTRRELDKRIEGQETFVSEVSEFREELQRVADLGLTVDHDDGVLLSIAPLHNLVPWSPAKVAWNELLAGKYQWSSIGKQLRTKGLVRELARG